MKLHPKKQDLEITQHRAKKEILLLNTAIKALEASINAISVGETSKAHKMSINAIFALRERLRELQWANSK